jgi:outer membrane protein assembly factor BamB
MYIAGREGSTVVLKHGPKMEVLAVNELSDGFDASPALVDGEIYLRGYRYLYCIAQQVRLP